MKQLLAILLILPLAAQVPLKPVTRAEVKFPTVDNQFYQIELKEGEGWKKVGEAFKGNGEAMTRSVPKLDGNYRLQPVKDEWVLVWSDEFEGKSIDFTKWAHEENGYGGGNNERQYYSAAPKYSYVKDGWLHLSAYRDPHTTSDGKTQPYTSARLRTMNRGDWKYGRFVISAKVPGAEGIWPAIWMLPTNSKWGGWAAGGEIDILESRGNEVDKTIGTLHFGGKWPKNTYKGTSYTLPGKNAAEAFHEYAIEWEKDEIRWYLDGKKYQTIKKEDWWSSAAKDNKTAPFDQPFHLIINLAVDGHFFGGTDQKSDRVPDSAFPQTLLVDYVRVYQR
ncbi:glycoside hydrolase family 16 protein [Akkermansiaceae bacterium]|nr:glycoside hydrolase family 16 protein [Akkermansiaceae bacterium]MDB4537768.1 glycoside hydrolase family 16 protein [Akkermansiaceae bacterium]